MTYIVNYTPETDDVFVYNQPFAVWPALQSQQAVAENPNLPLKNQTVVYNGETITYDIDLSGIENPYRANAYFYCPTCFQVQPNWPHCQSFWAYGLGAKLMNLSSEGCVLARSRTLQPGENIDLPSEMINPTVIDSEGFPINAQYWNDPNLWHVNTFKTNILIESESDDETYIWALGHAITTSPCNYDFEYVFFDRETNKYESRLFTCPCRAWDLPLTGIYPGGLQCNNCCAPPYSIFTSLTENDGTRDGYRLFVMKKGQEPLPKSIKRYKILLGKVRRDNWPVFGIDSSYRFIKGSTNPEVGSAVSFGTVKRSREDGNFRFGYFPYNSDMARINDITIGWDAGEGDDGPYPSFTISAEGETIFVSFNDSGSYGDYISNTDHQAYNQPLTENVPRPCTGENLFYKEDGKLKFNTYCYPAFFHPELVIPGYSEGNDINFYTRTPARGQIPRQLFDKWNEYLEELGKPKLVSYRFPEFTEENSNIFPENISDSDKKYPLFDSPYLSRQSKNSFFENTNLIDFNEKRMLQASELNELQEKFYKNQSLLIQYYNKWMSKNNFKKEIKDLLGFSDTIDLNWISSSIPKNTLVKCCKAIPLQENMLTLGSRNENNIAQIKLNPCNLMLHSNFQIAIDPDDLELGTNYTYYRNTDFIKISSEITGELDLSNITENNIHCITLSIDINNIITCNEYNELRDNSSQDDNSTAPCGANRNYLSPIQTSPIIQQNIDITGNTFLRFTVYDSTQLLDTELTPFNTINTNNIRYLLGYMKKENEQINFYYANGVKIQNI
jgi:hypothetical protein